MYAGLTPETLIVDGYGDAVELSLMVIALELPNVTVVDPGASSWAEIELVPALQTVRTPAIKAIIKNVTNTRVFPDFSGSTADGLRFIDINNSLLS
jgi:hypothetical protein